jgi:transposase
MLTGMTERGWLIALEVFDAVQSSRGEPGHDDRKFLDAIHYFTVHSITWRALPKEFGNWNSVWKRFWRLSRSGVFEAFFQMLAEFSETAHLIQFFDSTTARAHVSAAGAKGGSNIRPSAARVAAFQPKSICGRPPPCKDFSSGLIGSLAIICPACWWRPHMTAGQDGFRDASSKHLSGPQRPMDFPECLSSRIDRPHHLLIFLQVPASAQRGTVVLFVVGPIAGRSQAARTMTVSGVFAV